MAISYVQMQYPKKWKIVDVAFKILPDEKLVPICHQFVQCPKVFDFRHKASLMARGHMTEAPDIIKYASVVSRETVRIALMIAALNDLGVNSGNILNAYVQATVTESRWTILDHEFSKDARKTAEIVSTLNGLKLAGALGDPC